jgi:5-carboxymethyl-2-hydroxymuconate isomerase
MPVINFSYTNNLALESKIATFLPQLHQTLVTMVHTDLYSCRTTINKVANFYIGDGDQANAYIFLQINLLPGRSDALKDKLGKELYQQLNDFFASEIAECKTQVRVYLQEVDTQFYFGLPQ